MQTSRFYSTVAVLGLAVAASTGVLLRFGMVLGMPAWANDFGAVRHAHSHLMYFGWVTLGLMALIWHFLPSLTGRALPKGVGLQMATTAVLALLSFPAFWSNGYGLTKIGSAELPLGSMAAGLNGILWIVFVGLYFHATWGLPERPLPVQLWDWAVILLLIAFGGALGLVGLVVTDSVNISLQQVFLHLFLDLFAVGWFNLALLGVLWASLGKHAPTPKWLPSQSLAVFVLPTFLLGVSPIIVTDALFWLAAIANLGAAALLAWHLYALWQRRKRLPWLVQFGLVILGVHVVSALFVMWPGFWQWSAGTQLRVFFLHNFLLGWVSSGLLGIVMALVGQITQSASRRVTLVWGSGIVVMLVALLGVGFVQFLPVSAATWFWLAAWSSVLPAVVAIWSLGHLVLAGRTTPHPNVAQASIKSTA